VAENGVTPPTLNDRSMGKPRTVFIEIHAFVEFPFFADIEGRHRPVVAHHAGPYLTGLAFCIGKGDCLAGEVILVAKVAHGFCSCWVENSFRDIAKIKNTPCKIS